MPRACVHDLQSTLLRAALQRAMALPESPRLQGASESDPPLNATMPESTSALPADIDLIRSQLLEAGAAARYCSHEWVANAWRLISWKLSRLAAVWGQHPPGRECMLSQEIAMDLLRKRWVSGVEYIWGLSPATTAHWSAATSIFIF